MIPQRSISRISNALAERGGRRILESVIERDYCLAWLLCGLAGHPLRDALAFKGGTCLRRCWFADYRFSEDLDFTLTRDTPFSQIRQGLDEIFATVEAASGMRVAFDREDSQSHRNTHTFYLRYRGPLPAENDVKVDVTISETLCFPLQDRPILRSYDEYDDLPQGTTVRAYSLEEIVLEKLVALSDRARNEPRDLYDLWYLVDTSDVRIAELGVELEAKLAFRQRKVAGIEHAVIAKEDRLRRLWATRLAHQMNDLPPFERVFRDVQRALRSAKLPPAQETTRQL